MNAHTFSLSPSLHPSVFLSLIKLYVSSLHLSHYPPLLPFKIQSRKVELLVTPFIVTGSFLFLVFELSPVLYFFFPTLPDNSPPPSSGIRLGTPSPPICFTPLRREGPPIFAESSPQTPSTHVCREERSPAVPVSLERYLRGLYLPGVHLSFYLILS